MTYFVIRLFMRNLQIFDMKKVFLFDFGIFWLLYIADETQSKHKSLKYKQHEKVSR